MKLKLQYDSYLGPHVLPYLDANAIPRKGQTLDVGGVLLEVRSVMRTPFSRFHAAIVYVMESEAFFK